MPGLGNRWELSLVMTHGAQTCRCKLYGQVTGGSTTPTQAQLNTFANTVHTTLGVSLAPCLNNNADFNQVEIKLYDSGTEMEAFSTSSSIPGTNSGDMLPEECAVVIQRRTGKIGRNKRGRIFFPFVSETDCDDSSLTVAAIGRFKAFCTALNTPFVSGGITVSPRTPDFVNGLIEPVIQHRVLDEIMSRKQRRSPKKPHALAP